jgi:hypothetical protein
MSLARFVAFHKAMPRHPVVKFPYSPLSSVSATKVAVRCDGAPPDRLEPLQLC